ncbi:MAG: hypothetical protein JWO03_2947 [Bacteroidetes bacterium]|nr:hypothetical protein [Bacteroidota bacterium]
MRFAVTSQYHMKSKIHIFLIIARIIVAILLALWIAGCIIWPSCHLIATDGSEAYFKIYLLCFFAPYIMLVFILRMPDKWWQVILKISGIIIVSFLVMILMIPFVFADMCVERITTILYRNKADSRQVIVRTDFGCGATDSTPSTITTASAKQLTKNIFMMGGSIDTMTIDRAKWERVDEDPRKY